MLKHQSLLFCVDMLHDTEYRSSVNHIWDIMVHCPE